MKFIKKLFTDIDFSEIVDIYNNHAKFMHEGMQSSINLDDPDVREAMNLYIRNGLNPTKPLGKRHKFKIEENYYPSLNKVIDDIGLENCQCVIMSQEPGMFNMWHTDEYGSYGKRDKSKIKRVLIFLTDYHPCQFMQWGDTVLQNWQAGDAVLDWHQTPHGTANASEHTRVMLRLTGVTSEKYENFIEQFNNNEYNNNR